MATRFYGSLSRLVSTVFRKNSNDITLRPNQGTTYTASRDIQFPPGDAAHVLTSADSTQTLTNKTIDAASNTISNIANTNISASAAIDASKIADGTVSSTEFQFINSVTSNVQTQLNNLQPLDTDLTALAGLTTTGLIVRTGSGTATTRTLVAGTGISLTNANGVAGDITINASATTSSFAADWITANGTTKTVTHSLGSTDVIAQVYDNTDGATIYVDSVVRTDGNTLTLTSSEAPPAAGWRVLILKI